MSSLPALKVDVSNLHNKNQFVIEFKLMLGDEWVCFQSYSSECALYNKTKREFYLNENCWLSKTTSKHLYIFINEYTHLSVHSKKELEEMIEEGEIRTYRR